MSAEHKNIILKAKPGTDPMAAQLGDTYLAYSDYDESWYEAVVVEEPVTGSSDKPSGQSVLTLRWQDYDDEPPFEMARHSVALLPKVLPYAEG